MISVSLCLFFVYKIWYIYIYLYLCSKNIILIQFYLSINIYKASIDVHTYIYFDDYKKRLLIVLHSMGIKNSSQIFYCEREDYCAIYKKKSNV